MTTALLIYLLIGNLVNVHYHIKNAQKYSKALLSGEVKVWNFMLGGFLTILFWPVSIYNNEFRNDS